MAAAAVMTRAVLARPSAIALRVFPSFRYSSRIRDSRNDGRISTADLRKCGGS
jgi:hypothetical protein